MKQTFLRLFASIAFLGSGIAQAQNSRYLVVDQFTIPVETAVITDSSAGGRMVYLATFEITLRDNENILVLQKLSGSVSESRALNFSIRSTDLNGKVIEERFYQNASVQEIVLPALDAAGKNVVQAQVKIRAGSLSIKENAGTANGGLGKRSATALSSNFSMTLGNLLTKRVAKIGTIRITAGQLSSFVIEVSETDAKSWQDWLISASSKKESGAIELLGADFKSVLCRIELRDLEITSTTSQFTSNTETRAIGRLSVGLRGRVILGGGK